MSDNIKKDADLTRRRALKTLALGAGAAASAGTLVGVMGHAQAQSAEPIRIGFQVHRTGIGAAYGRWYDRTTDAVVKRINAEGGINGRPIEIVAEDDGTDPKRGAESRASINAISHSVPCLVTLYTVPLLVQAN